MSEDQEAKIARRLHAIGGTLKWAAFWLFINDLTQWIHKK